MKKIRRAFLAEAVAAALVIALLATNPPAAQAAAAVEAVSAQTVLKRIQRGQPIVLIDIRPQGEFETVWIPDAINVPLYFIKTKAFLKGKPLVLVTGGYPSRQTEAEYAKLIAKGFKVSILTGGMLAWQKGGGKLNGDLFSLERYRRISAAQLLSEKHRNDQVVIDVSEKQDAETKQLIPNAIHLPFPPRLSPAALRGAAAGKKYFVIFDKSGGGYEPIGKITAAADLENIFYLEGGFTAYRSYLANRILAGKSREDRIQRSSGCVPCGK